MITMMQIDEKRAILDRERETFRNLRDHHLPVVDAIERVRHAERVVEAALLQWWRQGCTESDGGPGYWRERCAEAEAKLREIPCVVDEHERREKFPAVIVEFIRNTWGEKNAVDLYERATRFFEEAIEFAQAAGLPEVFTKLLVGYVYGRPAGEATKEAGDVGITILAWCAAMRVDLDEIMYANHAEKATNRERLREKQRQKFRAGFGIDVEGSEP